MAAEESIYRWLAILFYLNNRIMDNEDILDYNQTIV